VKRSSNRDTGGVTPGSSSEESNTAQQSNPLLRPWDGPLGLPPFAELRPEHFPPAFEQGMREHRADYEAIANNPDPVTFANTALAVDRAGYTLGRVHSVFANLTAAHTSPALQEIERDLAPRLAEHYSTLTLHPGVFARLDVLYGQRHELALDHVQVRLVERFHLDAVRAGAQLNEQQRQHVTALSSELAALHTQFAQNVLADETNRHLQLTDDDLEGLPDWLIDAAAEAASAAGLPSGTRVITPSRSLVSPFLTTSTRSDLRQQAWQIWISRGENGDATDNRAIIGRILEVRQQLAALQGYDSFTEFQLDDTMAKGPAAVDRLLEAVWGPARAAALAEYEDISALARRSGAQSVEAWDWRYWAERVRQERYALDDDQLAPYFNLDNMLASAFDCASRLFGITFRERTGNDAVTTYHPDVRVFEVLDADGQLSAIFLSDNFARPTKRSGAWMSSYRHLQGVEAVPVVANHNNFAKPSAGKPTLLSIDDVRTLFHEFGHALHGMLSTAPFERLSGTAVLRDFVELPSQLFEHWAMEPEVLRRHARHVETGQPIPDALIAKLAATQHFNQGFDTVEFLASAIVDQQLHRAAANGPIDIDAFEREQLERIGMPAAMTMRHRLPHFQHMFSSSSYASAYYVYLWAEVLDADAYEAFTETGDPFNDVLAAKLHQHVYASGNTVEPGETYRRFRGRDPEVAALLRGRGLVNA
jgi:peptidyl-dipeptidase Dcp